MGITMPTSEGAFGFSDLRGFCIVRVVSLWLSKFREGWLEANVYAILQGVLRGYRLSMRLAGNVLEVRLARAVDDPLVQRSFVRFRATFAKRGASRKNLVEDGAYPLKATSLD